MLTVRVGGVSGVGGVGGVSGVSRVVAQQISGTGARESVLAF